MIDSSVDFHKKMLYNFFFIASFFSFMIIISDYFVVLTMFSH